MVKIEAGAKSALDPNSALSVRSYLADDIPDRELAVPNMTIVDAEHALWDKVVILHGLRRWFDIRDELRGGGHCVSRHYYDVHILEDAQVVRRFHGYFTHKMKLIRIQTPDVSRALKIFETLNDRGVGLDTMDLLKNLLFMNTKSEQFRKLKDEWQMHSVKPAVRYTEAA